MRFYVPPFNDHATQPRAFRQAFARFEQVIRQAERDYQSTLRPLLPVNVAQLMDAALHDAYIDALHWDEAAKRLLLRLTECGDDLRVGGRGDNPGYFSLNLVYHGVTMTREQWAIFVAVAQEPSAQILYHELDIVGGDAPLMFIQRTLWNTGVELERNDRIIHMWKPETEWHFTGLNIEAVPWQEPYSAPVRQITGLP